MTGEPQYARIFDLPPVTLGRMIGQKWQDDPKGLLFTLARYKHVARLLEGYGTVAEVGCGDGFTGRLVEQVVGWLDRYDFDERFCAEAGATQHDITEAPLPITYSAIYMLDVFEHIADTARLMENLCASLEPDGVLIIGIPSLESQAYASEQSRQGHVACMCGAEFRDLLQRYMKTVFLFGIQDETLTTGFYPMANYLLAVCAGVR
jgi:SAM-dependent methyltransferase